MCLSSDTEKRGQAANPIMDMIENQDGLPLVEQMASLLCSGSPAQSLRIHSTTAPLAPYGPEYYRRF